MKNKTNMKKIKPSKHTKEKHKNLKIQKTMYRTTTPFLQRKNKNIYDTKHTTYKLQKSHKNTHNFLNHKIC